MENVARTVDAKGQKCPMPVLMTAKAAKEMSAGEVMLIEATDGGARSDIPAWVSQTGNELIESSQEGEVLRRDRHAPGHMFQAGAGDDFALLVGERELLGEVGQDAQAVGAGIDHEVQAAFLALQIERAVLVEGGGHHREHARVASLHGGSHSMMWNWSR